MVDESPTYPLLTIGLAADPFSVIRASNCTPVLIRFFLGLGVEIGEGERSRIIVASEINSIDKCSKHTFVPSTQSLNGHYFLETFACFLLGQKF